jgi:hypothetical protein
MAAAVAWGHWLESVPLTQGGWGRWLYLLQLGILAAAGGAILWMAVEELGRKRTAEALLIALWVLGIFLFAVKVNWSLNVRALLPALPAVAILVVRRAERRGAGRAARSRLLRAAPLAAAAAASLLLGVADYQFASSAREAARKIGAQLRSAGRTALFEGHWGFQWYAEQQGMGAVDVVRTVAQAGDLLVLPATTSSNVFEPTGNSVTLAGVVEVAPMLPWLATMNPYVGAGFYADYYGALPFAVGRVPTDQYAIMKLVKGIQPAK